MSFFSVVVDPSAIKDLKRLKKSIPQLLPKLKKHFDSLSSDPYQGKPLAGNKKGCFSLREGDYRIIYEIHRDDKIVHIMAVGHRREIYR